MNVQGALELRKNLLRGDAWLIWDHQRRSRTSEIAATSPLNFFDPTTVISNMAGPPAAGVQFLDPTAVWIDKRTMIESDSVLFPNTSIRGVCSIGARVSIDCNSVIEDSFIEDGVEIGIGNIIRRTRIGARTKVPYNAELVNTEVGPDTNIARNVTVSNFDGLRKNKTRIGAGCLIGTDVNINGGVETGDEVRIYPKLFVTTRWIPDHAWVRDCRCKGRPHSYDIEPNRSFKIPGHWRWVFTRKSVDPIRMRDALRELGREFQGKTDELVTFWETEGSKLETPFYLPEK